MGSIERHIITKFPNFTLPSFWKYLRNNRFQVLNTQAAEFWIFLIDSETYNLKILQKFNILVLYLTVNTLHQDYRVKSLLLEHCKTLKHPSWIDCSIFLMLEITVWLPVGIKVFWSSAPIILHLSSCKWSSFGKDGQIMSSYVWTTRAYSLRYYLFIHSS